MTLSELVIKITCDSKAAVSGIEAAEKSTSKLSGMAGKVGSGMATMGKVIGGAVAAGVAGIAALATSAVKAYAEYEQLVGGVETLFKESAPLVQQYAHDAFKTVGVDANTYMKTVTSFSASLLQSVAGDTQKAAEVAHMAMVDMSDNANKMGTDMNAIMAAYQGFAKQNFTMLDNLKLGYGGTRKEMQRLLKDAQKLTGKKYNINNLKDIYEAIHAIQEELGIAGTTAKEAETTIQGSFNAMKSAWENLKIAMVDPEGNIDQALQDVISSAEVFGENIVPAISNAAKGIGTALEKLAPVIGEKIPALMTDLLPSLVTSAGDLISGLANGFIQSAPLLLDTLGNVFDSLVNNIKWPTWEEVKDFAIKAWDTIKEGASKLAGLVFGTKEDGSVDWPTWEDVQAAAGVAWDLIKLGAKELAGLIFGKKEDGSVDWPTWEDVQAAAGVVWEGIKTGVKALGGLIFGKKEDGSVDWPTWADVQEAAHGVWEGIKSAARNVGGIVFGKKSDGSVAWPTWEDVKASATKAWEAIKSGLASIVKWAIGKPELPTAYEMGQKVREWWQGIVSGLESLLKWVLGIPDNGDPNGTDMANQITKWWGGIVGGLQSILAWVLGIPTIGDSDGQGMRLDIQAWWDTKVKPFLGGILNFVLGLFGLPSASEMREKIRAWWEQVKSGLALAYSATINIFRKIHTNIEAANEGIGDEHTEQDNLPPPPDDNDAWDAKGDWNVPYDMPAMLHRGEMVLTRSQARKLRGDESEDGMLGGSGSFAGLASEIVAAIKEGMRNAQVTSYLDGKRVTDEISRIMGGEISSRRFA